MHKFAFKMKLKPGFKEEYRKRHDAILPELKVLLKENGISDYTIYFDAETDTLFAVQRQEGAQSSQDLSTNPIVQQWWAYMADIMEINSDRSPVSTPLEPVFHLE